MAYIEVWTFVDVTTKYILKMKKWSSQWTQFMQLRKEAWKKFRTSTGFEPVTSRFTGAVLYQLSINCVHGDDHFFIFISFSAVHIWFISYIINKIYFENHIFLPIVRSRSGSTKRENKQSWRWRQRKRHLKRAFTLFQTHHSHSISFNFLNFDELNSKGLLLRLQKEHEKSSLLK